MHVFGNAPSMLIDEFREVMAAQCSTPVLRAAPARSSVPHPQMHGPRAALRSSLVGRGFQHHVRLAHPRSGEGFEYDFWRPEDGVAIEVMGCRADDEIYKDILKFHVHERTRVGVVLVPRYKWISSRRTDTNFSAALKALAFADTFMDVEALVAISCDWEHLQYPAWLKGCRTDCRRERADTRPGRSPRPCPQSSAREMDPDAPPTPQSRALHPRRHRRRDLARSLAGLGRPAAGRAGGPRPAGQGRAGLCAVHR